MSKIYRELINCPKCGLECDGEAPRQPWFLQYICECGLEFAYDIMRDEFYDMDGNVIKGVK